MEGRPQHIASRVRHPLPGGEGGAVKRPPPISHDTPYQSLALEAGETGEGQGGIRSWAAWKVYCVLGSMSQGLVFLPVCYSLAV